MTCCRVSADLGAPWRGRVGPGEGFLNFMPNLNLLYTKLYKVRFFDTDAKIRAVAAARTLCCRKRGFGSRAGNRSLPAP